MSTSPYQQERQAIEAQIRQARERSADLEGQVRVVDGELQDLFAQRQQYQLLTDICESLDKLESLGAAHLFWGEQPGAQEAKERVEGARSHAARFLEKIAGIEQRRSVLRRSIEDELLKIEDWASDIADLDEQEERRKSEFLVERDISQLAFRAMVMPWDRNGEDERRFRKFILIALLISVSLGTGMEFWKLPPIEKYAPIKVPERLVKMVKKEQPPPPPKPVEKKREEKKEELVAEKKPTKPEKATTEEVKQARVKAESSGVLAFKNNFSDLMLSSEEPKLGAQASLGVDVRKGSGSQATGLTAQRSLVVAQGTGGSGGINVAGLSRNVGNGGGGGGTGVTGVGIGRVTSSIGSGNGKGADRPLSNGPGPSRTDEEIQIVFDRYKAALYRIYNRELRNDPTLRGKMILRITIEPDGSVSACKIDKTDLASATLSAEVLEKVKKFNFGAKEKVQRVTIIYPIDFLPAT